MAEARAVHYEHHYVPSPNDIVFSKVDERGGRAPQGEAFLTYGEPTDRRERESNYSLIRCGEIN